MDRQSTCHAAPSDDLRPVVDAALSHEANGSYGAASLGPTDAVKARDGSPVKTWVFNMLPPAMIAVVVLFWAFGPESWIKNPWSIIVAGALTTATVQALEWVHERHVGWRLNRREFATDLFYVVLGYSVISWVSTRLAENPLAAAKHSLGITTQWAMHLPFVVQVALVVFLVEFGQYWMHRAMHNSVLWWTHAPHHHITQLNAAKGAVGNPIELVLISLSVMALFDLPQAAQFCAFNILGVVSTFAHANVRSDPPRWYAFFFTTIRHHSLHHTALSYDDTRCNYGNSLILLDRIFGTYRDGESSVVGQDDRKRLSIWEQTIFPARPLIERAQARKQRDSAPVTG
jgi:sterol desaturase/sphingolipid hydroxylase (fatty acid hydroxylase superfamily)